MCSPGQPPELVGPAAVTGPVGTTRLQTTSAAVLAKPARRA